ncbi:MAG: hypothetical protein MUC97_12925 [Bernardetiaceae bacterium]|jgi:hypothetical protein|nr:hypothetical protein [Bernardetiaceae bacterium]
MNFFRKVALGGFWLAGLAHGQAQAQTPSPAPAQDPLLNVKSPGIQFRLNDDGSRFLRFTIVAQTWARWTQTNPGSTVFGTPKNDVFDISLRRVRMQFMGQLTDRVFFYGQIGQNNFNYLSDRKAGFFLHDALGEYAVVKKHLYLGGGLTAWTGPARFSSPAVGTIMALDAPLFEQANNDVNDQFLRRLSVYAKGKLSKLDYRVSLATPMSVQKASVPLNSLAQVRDGDAVYSTEPAQVQTAGYLMWQFFDQEANLTPYTTGTYLGKKKIVNVGAGWTAQPQAMWYRRGPDTVRAPMRLLALDVFVDLPTRPGRTDCLTFYGAYFNNNFGPGFVRNQGVNNPANGVLPGRAGSFNGAGNAFPIEGTGSVWFGEMGYKLKDGLLGKAGTLQPYLTLQYANYQRLADPMALWDVGFNWLLTNGYNGKLSFNYQSRPIYHTDVTGNITKTDRRGMFIVQYVVGIF